MRITNMRGVDLSIFQYDYDVTFAAFFMNARGRIYSRVFGRDQTDDMSHMSMPALQSTMRAVLKIHEQEGAALPEERPPVKWKKVEEIPVLMNKDKGKCVHCHQVKERMLQQAVFDGSYSKEMIRVYAPPENWGLALDRADSTRLKSVAPGSAADAAGLRAGDALASVNGTRILSQGDLFFAMNLAPEKEDVEVAFLRDGQERRATLGLMPGWKDADRSWRRSMRNLRLK